jgi:hypothetical protein
MTSYRTVEIDGTDMSDREAGDPAAPPGSCCTAPRGPRPSTRR